MIVSRGLCRSISFLTSCLLLINLANAATLAVISIDLGNENVKVGVVSPGKNMETVLNTDSARKTPLAVAFRDGDRFFLEAALTTATRFPEKVYTHLLDLIGKQLDNPLVQLYQTRFPYHNITSDPQTSGILLHHPDGLTFTPEELLAMLLEKVRLYAELYVGQGAKISDCTIVVPSYFTQNERKAVLKSAKLAGLNVLQLVNSNTAVALNYGLYRTADFVENKPKNYIFYDMGSTSTEATVVSYQIKRTKEGAYPTRTPELTILGVGYDRTLGGFEMQLRLRDHLARMFEEQAKKKKQDAFNNKRAMSKLLKEAGKVKNMLSANNEISVRVENVMNDIDLRGSIKRSELEEICSDLMNERVRKPIENALLASGLTISDIDQLILFGGNTRTPKIQQSLSELIDKELGKNVNSDEAASLGAAYLAGKLSKGFRAKDFIINEYNLFPVTVDFLKNVSHDPNADTRLVQRLLYTRGNAYPMKKVFTFNKKNKDFDFSVNYGDLSFLPKEEQSNIGSKNLMKVSLSNFDRFINNYQDPKYEAKGVKAHFILNEHGIVDLINTEYLYNEKVEEEVPDFDNSNVVSDAISNLGSKIGSLFSSSVEKDDATVSENQTTAEEKSNQDTKNDALNTTDPENNATQVNVTKTKIEVKMKPVKEKIDRTIDFEFNFGDDEVLKKSKDKLHNLKRKEMSKLARDKAKNTLESFIVDSKARLYDEEYEKASSEEEREKLFKTLNDASEWLEFESDNAETKTFNDKLKELTSNFEGLYQRVEEHRERPNMIKTLEETIEHGRTFLAGARNLSQEVEIFTESQLVQLEAVLSNVNIWKEEKQFEQNKTPDYETPKLTVAELVEKVTVLRSQINNLLNIAKTTKARPPVKKSQERPIDENKNDESKNVPNDEMKADAEETLEKLNQTGDDQVNPTKTSDGEKKHTEL